MDFGWSAEQDAIYARVRAFARQELEHGLLETQEVPFDHERWRRAGNAGFVGLSVGREYGGAGYDCLTTARALEAIGRECTNGGFGFALAAHLLACCVPIDRHGTPEQKRCFLPKLCSGEWIGANALSEPNSGSDAFALETRAVARGDTYVLDGEKMFVTNAPVSDVVLVYATTNPGLGMFSLSAFLVPRTTPGLTVGPALEKVGLRTAKMAAIAFDECVVPASQRLGAEGAGAAIFHDSMGWERSCLFALWVGALERQLDDVIAYANGREQFGRPLAANQAVSHRIADMALRLESARLLLYKACWQRMHSQRADLAASLAKLAVSEAFVQSSLDAVRTFGARGVLAEHGIERYLRDALPGTIYSGTSDMQREIIAREIGLATPRT